MTTLTAYEQQQYNRIAGWKAEPPLLVEQLVGLLEHPFVLLVEKLISQDVLRAEIKRCFEFSESNLSQERDEILRRAGVSSLAELQMKDLAFCDALAAASGKRSAQAALEHSMALAVSGGASALASVPMMIVNSLKFIHTIGFCYGFTATEMSDRARAFGVLRVASAQTLAQKQNATSNVLQEKDGLVCETIEDLVTDAITKSAEELAGSTIPFLGGTINAMIDGAHAQRVAEVAILTYQERWLLERGKIEGFIQPDPQFARNTLRRAEGAVGQGIYWTTFTVTFVTSFPLAMLWSFVPPHSSFRRGLAAGRDAAQRDWQLSKQRLFRKQRDVSVPMPATPDLVAPVVT